MDITNTLLLITCFLYGATGLIADWSDFTSKLINVLVITAIIVITLIVVEGELIYGLIPIGSIILGLIILGPITERYDDWKGITAILAGIGLIATIITTCCGI